MKKKIDKSNFRVINFNKGYDQPVYSFQKRDNIITWGKNNEYPNYLLDLFNYKGSSKHKMIIDKKVNLLIGQGFDPIVNEELQKFVNDNDLVEDLEKWAFDLEIFNGYCIEAIWSNDGTKITTMKHIPISQIRQNIVNDVVPYNGYWYCADWKNKHLFRPEFIHEWNPYNRTGKQLYFYSKYNPQNILVKYPIPYYSASINSIETDYLIGRFHLTDVKKGYAPQFILNFATGIPTPEEQDEFARQFEENYCGPDGEKVIITYSENSDGNPLFTKIDLNTSDERFIMLGERIDKDILQGSGIPLPLIDSVAGKLGSTEERQELMTEFQQSYIAPRQSILESGLNKIISQNNYGEKLILKKYAL